MRDEARAVFANTIVPRDFDAIEMPFPERGARARALGHVRESTPRRACAAAVACGPDTLRSVGSFNPVQ